MYIGRGGNELVNMVRLLYVNGGKKGCVPKIGSSCELAGEVQREMGNRKLRKKRKDRRIGT